MSLNHTIASGLRCNGCRYAVVRSFASISGVNLPFRDQSAPSISKASLSQRRAFGTTPTYNLPRKTRKSSQHHVSDEEDGLVEGFNGPTPAEGQAPVPIAWHLQESSIAHQALPAEPRNDMLEDVQDIRKEEPAPSADAMPQSAHPVDPSVPWYLQVQRPSQELDESHPMAHRQRIPELPENAPPILPEILQRISVDLGLDDLNLIDLRHLDPPPALGSKLIMIVGSARSEKHLHVSADRFCRWLRSTHKMKPHAAGLLGRNELKLKLRRKARRMRLLANVGGQEMDDKNIDDGIRTGWICVTVGRVKAAETEEPELPREGFIGFGRRTDGVNIVVQMFTEEKRQETDLEGLWERIERRATREKSPEGEQEEEQEFESVNAPPSRIVDALSETESRSRLPRVSNSQSAEQIRRLHTVGLARTAIPSFPIYGHNPFRSHRALVQRSQHTHASSDLGTEPMKHQSGELKALYSLLKDLKSMPSQTAREALGTGFSDTSSTAFLRDFHGKIPKDLGRQTYHYEAWMDLFVHALELEAPGYTIGDIKSFIRETALSGLAVTKHMYMTIFELWLRKISARYAKGLPSKSQLKFCYWLLQEMDALGYEPLTPGLMTTFHKRLTVAPTGWGSLSEDQRSKAQELEALARRQRADLRKFIAVHDLETQDPKDHLDLLRAYAAACDWRGFWDIWNGMARLMMPRSVEHYLVALEGVIAAGDQIFAQHALRAMVPDMAHERPPVGCTGEVASKMYQCLLIAEPKVEEEELMGVVNAEWVRLRDACRKASQTSV